MLVGAGVLFGLQQGLGVKLYIAIPVNTKVYRAVALVIHFRCGEKFDLIKATTFRPNDPAVFTIKRRR